MIRSLFFRSSMLAAMAIGLVSNLGAAPPSHPYHVSRAEVAYNAKASVFEVAICVWPEDLEKALATGEQARVDLDGIPEIDRDRLIRKYVASKFTARPLSAEGDTGALDAETAEPATIRWVGSEISLKQAWLYFEIEIDSAAPRWSFENRMFFELNEQQMNQVQIQESAGSTVRKQLTKSNFSRTLSASQPTAIWHK